MTHRWVLQGILLVGAAAFVVTALTNPALLPDVTLHGAPALASVWVPTVVGVALMWATTRERRRRDLAERCERALYGHPVRPELGWLVFFLGCFVAGVLAMSLLTGPLIPDLPFAPTARVVFMFMLPILFVDRAGFTLTGQGTAMPSFAMGVTEPWRWLGLLPAAVAVGILWVGMWNVPLPSPEVFLLGVVVAFLAISIPEEIFFRGMVQTRLEQLTGRWGGIVLTSALFALTYAAIDGRTELLPLSNRGFPFDLGTALLTYGVSGLLYGYTWACYRNIWLSILLRGSMLSLVMAPTLDLVD